LYFVWLLFQCVALLSAYNLFLSMTRLYVNILLYYFFQSASALAVHREDFLSGGDGNAGLSDILAPDQPLEGQDPNIISQGQGEVADATAHSVTAVAAAKSGLPERIPDNNGVGDTNLVCHPAEETKHAASADSDGDNIQCGTGNEAGGGHGDSKSGATNVDEKGITDHRGSTSKPYTKTTAIGSGSGSGVGVGVGVGVHSNQAMQQLNATTRSLFDDLLSTRKQLDELTRVGLSDAYISSAGTYSV
jgi:hypothetical protein